MTRPRDEQRDNMVVALSECNWSTRRIAELLKVSERTVNRIRVRRGINRPIAPRLSEEELSFAQALIMDGASYAEVARTLGRNDTTIRARFPGMSQCSPHLGSQYREMRRVLEALPPTLGL